MGMYGYLRSLSDAEIQVALSNPDLFYQQHFEKSRLQKDSFTSQMVALMQKYEASGIDQRMRAAAASGLSYDANDARQRSEFMAEYLRIAEKANFLASGKVEQGLDLDLHKSWHCLHFLLTGKAVPQAGSLAQAILGGMEIPDGGAMGYGPARILMPGEVRDIVAALKAFAAEDAIRNFDSAGAAAENVYCADHEPEELLAYFKELLAYYEKAARENRGMLLYIA